MMNMETQFFDLINRQREFFLSNRTKDIDFRKAQLKKLLELIIQNESEIFKALDRDFRKHPFESYLSESGYMILEIRDFIRRLNKWSKPKRLPSNLLTFPSSSFQVYEPYGVALIIAPWNYPFQLALGPFSGAMAAGNCAILKPSELTPNTSALMTRLINENFDDHYVHVVEGGAEVTQALLKGKFDYIFFTGGTQVGRIVATAAAKNLTPHTLEMGGKSPCFVDGSINLKLTARRVIWGKYINNGQTCVAPDYIYVAKRYEEALLQALRSEIVNCFGEDPEKSDDLARIVNLKHFSRLKRLILPDKVYYGGHCDEASLYVSPTILRGISWDDEVMKEEIFGPILPVLTYDDLSPVLQEMKRKDQPLAVYIFSKEQKYINSILTELRFGGGVINDTVLHYGNPHIPFGGTGQSGYGAYHGFHSFETFSHKKGILRKGNWLDVPLRYAPYTTGKMKWLRRLFRYNIEW